MSDVIDRINLVTQGALTYSPVAQAELRLALDRTVVEERRLYAIGFHIGAMVGLGVEDATPLRSAEALHFADRLTFPGVLALLNRRNFNQARRDEIIEASGLLMGYWEQTLGAPGATECWSCGRRIVDGLDEYGTCFDGLTCARCLENGVDHTYTCRRETVGDTYLEV